MIRKEKEYFILETKNTTYCFRVMETGHLEHLYYGRKLLLPDGCGAECLVEKQAFAPGNTNAYNAENPSVALEDVRLEMSAYGKGDIREPFIEVVHGDGSYTSDFLFDKSLICRGKKEFATLPGSYESLRIIFRMRCRQKNRERFHTDM